MIKVIVGLLVFVTAQNLIIAGLACMVTLCGLYAIWSTRE